MADRYPKEVSSFIHSNYKRKRPDELADLVNKEFGTEYSSLQMRYFMRNHKLRSGLPTGRKQPYTDTFPKEVVEYIKANYKGVGPLEMSKRLNEKFGKEYTKEQLKGYYGNHNINSGLTGRFEKGHVPVNPFKPGESSPNSIATQFKKGNIPINHREVGSERVSKDGYVEIKISEPNVWRMKHNVIWEEHNGKIPEGHKIIFLDRNPLNCDISNLEMVSNAVLLEMNRRRLHTPDPDFEQTAILIAKLSCAASDRQKGKEKMNEKQNGLKYDKEMYEDSGFYGDMEGEQVNLYRKKLVKVRKIHKCANCQKNIDSRQYALRESGFMDGAAVCCYTCAKCIEDWLEESGQVDEEEQEETSDL